MSMDAVARYLIEVNEIRCTGSNVPETSFYPALSNLFNEIGKSLSPKVRCVINLKNRGAGLPDGGLFTADQFKGKGRGSKDPDDPFPAPIPARGALEVKPPSDDLGNTLASEQVERYWKGYGLVLVTNLRSFSLVGKSPTGQPAVLETFTLANSESEFWKLVSHPKATADKCGNRLTEFLRRAMLYNAPLASAQDVAALLASYARDALAMVETADLPALGGLRSALEEALGLRFEGDRGEHFFRSTLVQTLFYGIFSAWVLWARRKGDVKEGKAKSFGERIKESADPYKVDSKQFDWHIAGWLLRVPMIRALFEQVATPSKLGPLGLTEILNRTAAALNRVDRASFFTSFDAGQAVQYFYEPFLQAFDPVLRKDLGVWYTPSEIVEYQVERVDRVLREELDIPDGLADPRVYVLDPCCGTATYLRSVLLRIAKTLEEKGSDALMAHDLKKAAIERIFGFELLPAPFVVSHLQLGLLLDEQGAPLSDSKAERVGVYLTNALTGWEPPKEKMKQTIIALPELAEERDAAEKVKREKPILVILGNPPYNAFAGISPKEENKLVDPYKQGLVSEWGIKKFNLDELYVRFFRLAEKRIAEKGGRGVISFISNFSYLGDASFVVMRKRFLNNFDRLWFDCMNGDSRETGKLTPEGKTDPSVFSTEYNREGIRVGTAVCVLVRKEKRENEASVKFRHFWGTSKRADILDSLNHKDFESQYSNSAPRKDNRWTFRPSNVAKNYRSWPLLTELCAESPSNGLMEKRGGALMDSERHVLEVRMKQYFDERMSFADLRNEGHPLIKDAAAHNAKKAREKALSLEGFMPDRLIRYAIRPFDYNWCYYTGIGSVWNRSRPALWAQCWEGNAFILSRFNRAKDPEGVPFFFTRGLSDDHLLSPDAAAFPYRLKKTSSKQAKKEKLGLAELPGTEGDLNNITANLSLLSRTYIKSLGLPDPDTKQETAELIWFHVLAVGYSPAYLSENADGIRQDWPRIPLPADKDLFLSSAALGRQIAALLDTEKPVPGVTEGKIPEDLRQVAVFERIGGGTANPDEGDLDLTAGWGHAGKGGITMPGKGKIADHGDTLDIYLNDRCCWRNVPKAVWAFTIGGYQVIKKWLSYREKSLLGRGLTIEEVRYVMEMARRLKAIVDLQPALDESYRKIAGSTYRWE